MRKKLGLLFTSLFVFLMVFANVSAASYELGTESSKASFSPEEKAVVNFIIKSNEQKIALEPFKCEIKFDSNTLKYSKINCKGNIKRTDIKLEKTESGVLDLTYNPKKLKEIAFENNRSDLFEIIFTVKNKVTSGKVLVHADFKNPDSYTIISSNDAEININGNPDMENCKLKSLSPDSGGLSPEFNPNVFDYNIEVSSKTKNLDFTAVPISENLQVKISRIKLAAAGKTTNIKITVSNRSLKIKSIYNIEVKRNPRDTAEKVQKKEKEKTKEIQAKEESKTKGKLKKAKKQPKYDSTEIKNQNSTDSEENSELEIEETNSDNSKNNVNTAASQNNSSKIYWIIAFFTLIGTSGCYFTLKFIKSRKNLTKKLNNSLNKGSEK